MFFLETNGLKNVLSFLGMWQFPSSCNVKQQARALSLKQQLSLRCCCPCCVRSGDELEEHEGAEQPSDAGAAECLVESVEDLSDLGLSPRLSFPNINSRIYVISQFHCLSVQHCFPSPKAWQICQAESVTSVQQSLTSGLVRNGWRASPSLQMIALTKYFILAIILLIKVILFHKSIAVSSAVAPRSSTWY